MQSNPHLRMVKYDPNDYSLGSVLNSSDKKILSGTGPVSAALSLYFQWPEKRDSYIYSEDGTIWSCEIRYDEDEAQPTELFLSAKVDDSKLKNSTVHIKILIFDSCFSFEAQILDRSYQEDRLHLIISVPNEIQSQRSRSLIRTKLSSELSATLYNDKESKTISIFEVSLNSLVADTKDWKLQPGDRFTLRLNDHSFGCNVTRKISDRTVLQLHFRDEIEYGRWFDMFAVHTFQGLVNRDSVDPSDVFKLYRDANYFGQLSKDNALDIESEIKSTWNAIRGSTHVSHANYVTSCDSTKTLTGASSLCLSHMTDGTKVWTFTQLASLKRTESIVQSGTLYQWRAAYLLGRPEKLIANGFFRSQSRWLERIYVKHAQSTQCGSTLDAVVSTLETIAPNTSEPSTPHPPAIHQIAYGEKTRYFAVSSSSEVAFGPAYLNAGGFLNIAIGLNTPYEQIRDAASRLLFDTKSMTTRFMLLTRPGNGSDAPRAPFDRYFVIPKEDLLAFLANVDHSIQVTKRKFESNGRED